MYRRVLHMLLVFLHSRFLPYTAAVRLRSDTAPADLRRWWYPAGHWGKTLPGNSPELCPGISCGCLAPRNTPQPTSCPSRTGSLLWQVFFLPETTLRPFPVLLQAVIPHGIPLYPPCLHGRWPHRDTFRRRRYFCGSGKTVPHPPRARQPGSFADAFRPDASDGYKAASSLHSASVPSEQTASARPARALSHGRTLSLPDCPAAPGNCPRRQNP